MDITDGTNTGRIHIDDGMAYVVGYGAWGDGSPVQMSAVSNGDVLSLHVFYRYDEELEIYFAAVEGLINGGSWATATGNEGEPPTNPVTGRLLGQTVHTSLETIMFDDFSLTAD